MKCARNKVKLILAASDVAKKRNRIFSRRQSEQRAKAKAWLCAPDDTASAEPPVPAQAVLAVEASRSC